jgi:hypothetical protein
VPSPWDGPDGTGTVPPVQKHIAQFAHREVIRYSMPGRSPDSRMPSADEMPSHATGAVTKRFVWIRLPLRGQSRN